MKRTLFLVAMATCLPILAATPTDFYAELLRRGVAEVEAGRNESALTPLRLAAFGFIDSIEHYQTAQVYLVVALDRMSQTESARDAAVRLVAAERIEPKFASLPLPQAIRNAFTAAATKLLSPAEVAMLSTPPATAPPTKAATTRQEPRQQQTSSKLPQVDAPRQGNGSSSPRAAEKPAVVEKPSAVVEKPVVVEKPPVVVEKPAVVEKPPAVVEKPTVVEKPPAAPATPPASSPATRRPDDAGTPSKPAPAATTPKTQPAKPAIDAPTRLAAGERALLAASLPEARKIYRELLEAGGHDHATWIRIAEGLYRSRDFSGALAAFQHVGPLLPGEEAYRYYIAVASYETGQYDRAKRELAAALPFIEITPDVQRYRVKIEAAR